MSFQACICFVLWNKKYLEECWQPNSFGSHRLQLFWQNQWEPRPFIYQHSSKHLYFVLCRRKTFKFGKAQGWVNNDRISIFDYPFKIPMRLVSATSVVVAFRLRIRRTDANIVAVCSFFFWTIHNWAILAYGCMQVIVCWNNHIICS